MKILQNNKNYSNRLSKYRTQDIGMCCRYNQNLVATDILIFLHAAGNIGVLADFQITWNSNLDDLL